MSLLRRSHQVCIVFVRFKVKARSAIWLVWCAISDDQRSDKLKISPHLMNGGEFRDHGKRGGVDYVMRLVVLKMVFCIWWWLEGGMTQLQSHLGIGY
jgi:hypothetical protein